MNVHRYLMASYVFIFTEKFAKKIIQSYYAAVTYIDDLIGQLLNELEILKIRKNTVVVLTSDHGKYKFMN
jgi:arylsulfatase A-like enzyme